MTPKPKGHSQARAADLRAAEGVAAEWVVRHQQPLTRSERAEFEQWLRSSPRHAEIYEEMNATSGLLDRLRAPAADEVVLADQRNTHAADIGWWRLPVLVAAAAAIVVAISVWRPSQAARPALFVQTVNVEKGSLRKLDLPDGSIVQVNAESAVDVDYRPSERRVRLGRGEAHFTVAHEQTRPFIVTAGDVSVRAVGTAFDVKVVAGAIEVLVTHGKVQVTDAASNVTPLVAGQSLRVPLERTRSRAPQIAAVEVAPVEIQRRLAWKNQWLEFSGVSLADVVAEFNRHNEHRIRIADPALAELHFGGAFTPHGYEALVELLEESFGVTAERKDHETILRWKP